MLQFILLYSLVLILSAVALNGFYNITRGEWYTRPDGKQIWVGKIFSFWSRFIEQHKMIYVNYRGSELLKVVSKLHYFFSDNEIIAITDVDLITAKMTDVRKRLLLGECKMKNLECLFQDIANETIITFQEGQKEYRFPNIIVSPLSGCITCISSVWGTVCWLFWYHLITSTDAGEMLATLETPYKAGLWIFFCIALAYLNELLYFFNDKNK